MTYLFLLGETDDDSFEEQFHGTDSLISGEVGQEYYTEPTVGKIHHSNTSASHKANYVAGENDYQWIFISKRMCPRLCEIAPYISIDDFEKIKYVGKGAHSTINLAKWNLNGQYYALKTCDKNRIARFHTLQNLTREKDILDMIDHPSIVRLEATFQDESALYFCLEYHSHGDLASLIRANESLPLDLIRFYAMEIINALECLQSHNVVHRDMKPENILINNSFHWWLSDFGSAKVIDPVKIAESLQGIKFCDDSELDELYDYQPDFDTSNVSANHKAFAELNNMTFVGSPLYVSPEMLLHSIASFSSDLWGLGWILFQWACGYPPFKGTTENIVFEQILEWNLEVPADIDPTLEDLILSLLNLNPNERLGAGIPGSHNDLEVLKSHAFFRRQRFEDVHSKKVPRTSSLKSDIELAEAEMSADDINMVLDNVQL